MSILVPSFLPAVDEVDVVILRAQSPRTIGDETFVAKLDAAPRFRANTTDAQEITRLWRALPPGDYMRCHIPPFGLRFHAEGHVFCRASICWECNNIIGRLNDSSFECEFDAENATSQALLALLRRCEADQAKA